MNSIAALVLGAALLYGLHRLALWAERRGWIYYLKNRGSSGALGNAALEVQAMFEPAQRHVLEERLADMEDHEQSGDPPLPDDKTR